MKRTLFIFFLFILALFVAACASATSGNTIMPQTQTTSGTVITTFRQFHDYPLPQTRSGMMRPAIDHKGRIWFGEMGHNYLAVFDPRTQKFRQMIPPHGQGGIMGVEVANDDTIWFAEQYANYIGQYNQTTGKYHIYSLPTLTTPDPNNPGQTLTLPYAPNDLAFDSHGNIWFTEMNADSIAKLDPRTGNIRQYPLSPLSTQKSVQKLSPYGITADAQNNVWFTEAANAHIGRLDPTTGLMRFFTLPGPNRSLMEIASDAHGMIWATSFSNGLVIRLDPQTNTFTSYYVASHGNDVGGIYSLLITTNGEIWITISSENMLARLDVQADQFIYYPLPVPSSLPLGVVMGANHTLWFTEAGSDKIGMLQP